MRFDPYLTFDGNCREAFAFYQCAIGGTITTMMTYGESPAPDVAGPGMADRILHATLDIGGSELLGYDAPTDAFKPPQGFRITLQADTVQEAERIFAGLGAGGTIVIPLAAAFWTKAYGEIIDRFGIHWMVNCA
jgi:PhnB protein